MVSNVVIRCNEDVHPSLIIQTLKVKTKIKTTVNECILSVLSTTVNILNEDKQTRNRERDGRKTKRL